jgi:hypothetical protein
VVSKSVVASVRAEERPSPRTARPSPAKKPWNISVSFECRNGTIAGLRPWAAFFWLACRTSMHWPRTMSDLLIEPASLRRSPGLIAGGSTVAQTRKAFS